MSDPQPLHLEYAIGPRTARSMARSATLYRVTRPAFLGAIGLEIVAAILFSAAGRHTWALALVAAAVVTVLLVFLQASSLARALAVRGFRPGTTMTVDWHPDTFVITTPRESATHARADVRQCAVHGDAALLRLRGSRLLIVLPASLVPPEVRPESGARTR